VKAEKREGEKQIQYQK